MSGSDFRISLQLLWGRRERGERGPKPALTVERIVARRDRAGRRRGARGGVDAARRGAARRRRDVALPLRPRQDRAARADARRRPRRGPGEPPDGDWRARLEWLARRSRARIRRHPWMLQVVVGQRPPLGPNIIGDFDAYLAGGLRHRADAAGDDRGRPSSSATTSRARPAPTSRPRRPSARAASATSSGGASARSSGRTTSTPSASRRSRPRGRPGAYEAPLDAFEFGLQRILDGIEALLAGR